jgi:hypothetical protein
MADLNKALLNELPQAIQLGKVPWGQPKVDRRKDLRRT